MTRPRPRTVLFYLVPVIVSIGLCAFLVIRREVASLPAITLQQVASALQEHRVRVLTQRGDDLLVTFADGHLAQSRIDSDQGVIAQLVTYGVTEDQFAGIALSFDLQPPPPFSWPRFLLGVLAVVILVGLLVHRFARIMWAFARFMT